MVNLDELIATRENGEVEFKSSFGAEAIRSLSAFSNSKGGKVFIGLNNKGGVLGVEISQESIQKWTNEIKTKTHPSIIPDMEIFEVDGENIVMIKVKECPFKPVSYKGRYYIFGFLFAL